MGKLHSFPKNAVCVFKGFAKFLKHLPVFDPTTFDPFTNLKNRKFLENRDFCTFIQENEPN